MIQNCSKRKAEGRIVKVYWTFEKTWFRGIVKQYNILNKTLSISTNSKKIFA